MGSKPKFWCRESRKASNWLFKFPQAGSGQHWAEKIAAEVANAIGSTCRSWNLPSVRDGAGQLRSRSLSEGTTQLARQRNTRPDDGLTIRTSSFGQSGAHSGQRISARWSTFVRPDETAADAAKLLISPDTSCSTPSSGTRTAIRQLGTPRGTGHAAPGGALAPSFDHASSLGRELRDRKRTVALADRDVGAYFEKGRGGIFRSACGRYGPSPLNPCGTPHRRIRPRSVSEPVGCGKSQERFRRFPEDHRAPGSGGLDVSPARDFAVALLTYNATEIGRCLE